MQTDLYSPSRYPLTLRRAAGLTLLALAAGACTPNAAHTLGTAPLRVQMAQSAAGRCPLPPPRRIDATTASPVALCLRADAAAGIGAGLWLQLDVLDADGGIARDAVVQPRRLRTDAQGYAPPITFLAAGAGDYVVRARHVAGSEATLGYSPRLIVKPARQR